MFKVLLEADVEQEAQRGNFCVKNFRVTGHVKAGVLPEINIRCMEGRWVHRDSGWQSALSEAAGVAIEKACLLANGADRPEGANRPDVAEGESSGGSRATA